jgi:hypothetical protein
MIGSKEAKEKRKKQWRRGIDDGTAKAAHSKKWNGYTGPSLSNTMLVLSCIPSSAPIKFIFRTQQRNTFLHFQKSSIIHNNVSHHHQP